MSGTGKSMVIGDAGPFRSPVAVDRDWVWREDRIQDLLSTEDTEVLFLSGCAENMPKFLPQFDHVVLLSTPADYQAALFLFDHAACR